MTAHHTQAVDNLRIAMGISLLVSFIKIIINIAVFVCIHKVVTHRRPVNKCCLNFLIY